jgi:predicted Zn-dependent protease
MKIKQLSLSVRSLLLIPLLAAGYAGADQIQLPDMGASSATVLTPQKESEVGRDVMRNLRRSGRLVSDPFIEDYLEHLGYRLLSVTDTGTTFTFFVLDEPSINAFALPGGYVGVNGGLIIASRSESELAGVVAHEISHVTQSHIARSLETEGQLSMPVTAAIIAALVLGRQNPQMGEAALLTAMAGSTQSRLDFSRQFEQEADRVGISLMAQAGFDPEGMPSFFERLYQETRFSGGESSELEFLRTHPVTVARIADSRNRAAQYANHTLKTPTRDYELVKAILRVRAARDMGQVATWFQNALQKGEAPYPAAAHLGLALARLAQNRPADARAELNRAAGNHDDPLFMRISADIYRASGQPMEAEAQLRRASALFPDDRGVAFAYTRLMLEARRYADAASLISAFLRRHDVAQAYGLLAEAETGRNRPAAAHLAVAEQYYRQDELMLAIDQLKLARNDTTADFYTLSRVDARLAELERQLPSPLKK